jgi:collagen beta-1,O-galactosyltransferase
MEMFVVNLARRPDRRARMERIVPAAWAAEYTTDWTGPTDGAAMAPGDLDGFGLFPWATQSDNEWWNRPLKLGELGCAVSRLALLAARGEAGCGADADLEDDVSFAAGVEVQVEERVAELETIDPAWDLVYLGRWALEGEAETEVPRGDRAPGLQLLHVLLHVERGRAVQGARRGLRARPHPGRRAAARLVSGPSTRRCPAPPSPAAVGLAFEPPLVVQLPEDVAGSDTDVGLRADAMPSVALMIRPIARSPDRPGLGRRALDRCRAGAPPRTRLADAVSARPKAAIDRRAATACVPAVAACARVGAQRSRLVAG